MNNLLSGTNGTNLRSREGVCSKPTAPKNGKKRRPTLQGRKKRNMRKDESITRVAKTGKTIHRNQKRGTKNSSEKNNLPKYDIQTDVLRHAKRMQITF